MIILIAVCMYRIVMISIKWSETAQKKCTGQHRRNSNPVATLLHATVVFYVQSFNFIYLFRAQQKHMVQSRTCKQTFLLHTNHLEKQPM